MIRVSVLYPAKEGGTFDHDYYAQKHMPMVKAKLGSLGLLRAEIDRGVAGGAPKTPAPFACIGHLYFNSVADFQKAMGAHGAEIMADVPNYTTLQLQVQISEVAEVR